jgi:hypothetical membrane protein
MNHIAHACHHAGRRVKVFTDKYPLLGPLIWALSVQTLVVQFVVAQAWPQPYSWLHNLISDLGNSACGPFGTRYVCSPQNGLMNASFMLLGLTMAVGALLVYQEFQRSRTSLVGFSVMAIAGFGTILVGAFPENTIFFLHGLGAFLALGLGNASIVILALGLKGVRQDFRVYTLLSGLISLAAMVLFVLGIYLGVGPGGMERVVSYPQTIWLTLFGLYMTATRVRARRGRRAPVSQRP